MRTVIPAVAVVLASLIGGMANAIYKQSARRTTANPTRMSLSLAGPQADSKNEQEQKLRVEPVWVTAFETIETEERVRTGDQMLATGTAALEADTNAPAAKRVSSEKSDEPKSVMLRRRLGELQAQRRWIEEEENSLRFAVLETELNAR